ncbi:molybdopterin-dependent oxidoreductase [Loktanella sp. Alg231-35]|uniref:molybdopterin-dependent oxidoreductase n=1 Tax=Loktanella sp. Alg231-35 TaxID=1922220 RepID=UPI000D557760|nr:molybdopterin-dependent oxidoreductase [Loktanella sp. Alg231-35]
MKTIMKTLTLLLATAVSTAAADDAQGVILTLSSTTQPDVMTEFTLVELEALGEGQFTTTTIWTTGPQTFSGISLDVFLASQGIESGTILASAINDYTVEIPVSDATDDGPMIAYRLNGEEMSIRDKGPLWIVYPYDSKTDYQAEVIYSRSIWQLDRITIAN